MEVGTKKKLLVWILLASLPLLFFVWWLFGGVDTFSTLTLLQEQEIHGIKFPEGSFCLYRSGRLEHVALSQDQEIRGKDYYKGDTILFDRKGNVRGFIKHLEEDAVIQGIKCTKENRPNFYESGKLMAALLSEEQEIQGIRFPQKTLVAFHESGELETAIIFQDCRIQGKECPEGTEIVFEKSGKIRKFRFPKK